MSARGDADEARRRLAARDQKLLNGLGDAYGVALTAVRQESARVAAQIDEARRRGTVIDEAWLAREGYLTRLERVASDRVRLFATSAATVIDDAVLAEVASGSEDAARLLRATLPASVARELGTTPLDVIVARVVPGGRLRMILDQLPADAAQRAREALIRAVALGHNPTRTAGHVRDALGGNLARAVTIARTETISAYRDAALARYRASGVVDGWVWDSTRDARTCAVCWAMHGSQHRVDEPFASHPNCRCTPLPLTKLWADLGVRGVPETRFQPVAGETLFARLPASRQREVLGPGKLDLYRAGRIGLADLVQPTVHPVYGRGLRERPIRDLTS